MFFDENEKKKSETFINKGYIVKGSDVFRFQSQFFMILRSVMKGIVAISADVFKKAKIILWDELLKKLWGDGSIKTPRQFLFISK